MPERPDEKWIGTVEWNYNEYAAIRAKYTWQETPSTLRVTMAQEDLWVYEVLLRAIKKTNEHAGGSAIRRIVALQIGAAAVKGWMAPENLVFKGTAKVDVGPVMSEGAKTIAR